MNIPDSSNSSPSEKPKKKVKKLVSVQRRLICPKKRILKPKAGSILVEASLGTSDPISSFNEVVLPISNKDLSITRSDPSLSFSEEVIETTPTSAKNDSVSSYDAVNVQSLAASRPRRLKKTVDPREDRPISSANKRNIGMTDWLCDDHIDYASMLLRKLNQEIGGLFNIDNGLKKYPKASGKWIQLLHNGRKQGGHWVCAAYGFHFIPAGHVFIYDSLSFSPNNFIVGSIASLLETSEKHFDLRVAPSSQQTNSFDCGVYAIAVATSIIYNIDPSSISFAPSEMRQHLKESFSKNILTPFPYVNNSPPMQETITMSVEVFCVCRRPIRFKLGKNVSKEEKMIKCDLCSECFHLSCLANGVYPKGSWRCETCA